MPHRTERLVLAAASALALAALIPPAPAAAAPPSTAKYTSSTPSYASASKNCGTSKVGACTLGNGLLKEIRAIPAGGRLDITLYSVNRPDLVKAVLSAADRKVKVRLLTSHPKPDGEDEGAPLSSDATALVKGLRARHQTVTVGWGALARSGTAGIQHQKLVLINDGRGHKKTISDSGNWTWSLDRAFNDRMTIVDRCLYDGALKHLDVLAKDRDVKTSRGAVVKTCDGRRRLYFLPEAKTDPVLAWAKSAKCGKGDRVVFANFYLTKGKKATTRGSGSKLADQLIRFRKAGVTVEVAANDRTWSESLRKRFKAAGVTVWDVNNAATYDHRKMLAGQGCGKPFGAQGSTTMNKTAYDKNSNQIVTTTDVGDVRAMLGGFSAMTHGAKKV